MKRRILIVSDVSLGWESVYAQLYETFDVIISEPHCENKDLSEHYKILSAVVLCIAVKTTTADVFVQRLRSNPVMSRIPLIVIADEQDESIEMRFMNSGATEYFTRQMSMKLIVKHIGNLINLCEMTILYNHYRKEAAISARIKAIMGNIASGITAVSLEKQPTKLLFSNEKFYEIIGDDSNVYQLRKLPEFARVSLHDQLRVFSAVQSMELDSEITLEYRIIHHSGEERWVRHHLSVLKLSDEDGIVRLGILDDITDEKEAENELLRATARRHRSELLDDSSSAVSVRDAETYELLYINNTCAQMYGKDLAQAQGLPCYRFLKNRTTPCESCCMHNSNHESFTESESTCAPGKHYLTRSKFIYWDNRHALVEFTTDETNRIDQRLELIASHHALESAVKNAGISFWIYDIDSDTASWKGFSQESPFGDTLVIKSIADGMIDKKYVHPEDAWLFAAMHKELEANSESCECTVRIKSRRNGGYNYYHLTYTRLHDLYYQSRQAVGYAQNVDLQMNIKIQYDKEIQLFDELMKDSLVYYELDITNRIVVSAKSKKSEGALLKQGMAFSTETVNDILQNVYEEDRQYIQKKLLPDMLEESFRNGETSIEVRYRRYFKDGELHWLSLTAKLIKQPNTDRVSAFLFLHDVNDEEIEKLAISSIVMEDIELLSVLHVHTGRVRIVKTKHDLHAVRKSVFIPMNKYFTKILPFKFVPGDKEKCMRFFNEENLLAMLKKSSFVNIVFSIQEKDGTLRRKNSSAYYLNEAHSEIVMTRRDITNLYEEEQRQKALLQAAADTANEANHAKDEFLSRMSHDMRTPMNAILGMSYLAQEETETEKIHSYLKNIDNSSRYLLGLINDVLELSKMESGKTVLKEEPYSLAEFESGITTVIQPLMRAKNITFDFSIASDNKKSILVDKLRFNQVFYNLLTNASIYTQKGGRVSFVSERIPPKDDKCGMRFFVRDNGIGMSREFLKRIFMPFTQENNPAITENQGSGLGLSIVKNLVDLMGGSISVKSEQGKGSEFTLDLYFKEVQPSALDSQPVEENFAALNGMQILLVEDNEMNIIIAQTLLAHKGCIVTVAHNGAEAVNLFADSTVGFFDAILMDVRMPVMNGLEATRVIRAFKRPDAKFVPIIAMTADAFTENKESTKEAGMNVHLSKPIVPDVLFTTLLHQIKNP